MIKKMCVRTRVTEKATKHCTMANSVIDVSNEIRFIQTSAICIHDDGLPVPAV